MSKFHPGQSVRILSAEEIADVYGYSLGDFMDNEIRIDNVCITDRMTELFGKVFIVDDIDDSDNSVYLYDTEYWWPSSLLILECDEGSYFGFKVGDQIEFLDWSVNQYVDWFVPEMKSLCGTTGTIIEIAPENRYYARISVKDKDEHVIDWSLNTSMVEHLDLSPDVPVEDWLSVAFQ